MAEEGGPSSSRANLKRRSVEDLISDFEPNKRPRQREVKFPKGKKAKQGQEPAFEEDGGDSGDRLTSTDPRVAAKERALRRSHTEHFNNQSEGALGDIASAEVDYEDDGNFDDEGVPIEPFNLKKEREEGYFDSDGNFVEYRNEKDEIRDAWMDTVGSSIRPIDKSYNEVQDNEDNFQELTSVEVGKIKRRIANLLQPEETVLQALRRLKETSGDKSKRSKMSGEIKVLFDQLTDDAVKLMESGEYNVYHDTKETFVREAEGYERIASARNGTLTVGEASKLHSAEAGDMFANDTRPGVASISDANLAHDAEGTGDAFDMFGEEDEVATTSVASSGKDVVSDSSAAPLSGPASENPMLSQTADPSGNEVPDQPGETDYVFDESSGYYYSASLGYYYDPSSSLYCSAASGKWYAFNEVTNSYEEVGEDALAVPS